MSKRAILRCDGSLEQGFGAILEIRDAAPIDAIGGHHRQAAVFTEVTGFLPPEIELIQLLATWQQHYLASLGVSRICLESISTRIGSLAESNNCRQLAKELQQCLIRWLASSQFQIVEQRLRETLDVKDSVEVLLRTNDRRLHRLPWHRWDFIERYPHAEVSIGSMPQLIAQLARPPHLVRILAILGDRQGIDIEADRQLLANLPQTDVVFLVEPSRQEVYSHLWEQTWDILFFAGHSNTEQQQGRIHLSAGESLTIDELRYGLRRAIVGGAVPLEQRGLQLAIFNSCDGLGLAYELEQLHLPQSIVMREPVPDRVALVFLKQFLSTFAGGGSLHSSVRQAREYLQGWEGEFPCASWLPIIFQNPAMPPLKWHHLQGIQEILIAGGNAIELKQSPKISIAAIDDRDRFYITSPYENRCNEEVKKPGSLIRIKSPHKMGKSLLMARVLNYAQAQGYRTVTIDLAQTNQKFFGDVEKFMQWFCASVGKSLGIRIKIEEYWDDIFGANDNSTDYFENYLFDLEDSPLVLAIDNFDRVFQYPDIETDLCGLLRGWHERSKTKSQWQKLRLMVVHSQEPYAQMDINQSPFNIGLPIELGEFTPAQVRESIERHGLIWHEGDLDRFVGLIGGHPHLVRSALYTLTVGDLSLDRFLKTAPTEAGIYGDLLRGHLKVLEDLPELGVAMKKVVEADFPVNLRSAEAFKLDSMGLIVRVENDVLPRCNLYRQYFREHLGSNE
jgi:AAA-like domain/CHAT domain